MGANKKTPRKIGAPYKVAGSQGFEPRLTVPKTEVLPLHHEPKQSRESRNQDLIVK